MGRQIGEASHTASDQGGHVPFSFSRLWKCPLNELTHQVLCRELMQSSRLCTSSSHGLDFSSSHLLSSSSKLHTLYYYRLACVSYHNVPVPHV